ncbi:MAG: hypothetical protein LBB18_00185, partial [Puniceicoccales bacterium]|nr:hypothetical protein [Puniceicoccales bacterium]
MSKVHSPTSESSRSVSGTANASFNRKVSPKAPGTFTQLEKGPMFQGKDSSTRKCDTTAPRRATHLCKAGECNQSPNVNDSDYVSGLKIATTDIGLNGIYAEIWAEDYARVRKFKVEGAMEIYENAYLRNGPGMTNITYVQSYVDGYKSAGCQAPKLYMKAFLLDMAEWNHTPENSKEYAMNVVKSYIEVHNSVFRKHGSVAANVYDKAFLLAMDKPNSTPENSKEYAMNVVKSYIEDHNYAFEKHGSVAANVYDKAFLLAMDKPNSTPKNSIESAVNITQSYIRDHNFLSKKYGSDAANVYDKALLLDMDKPNSTPENNIKFAANITQSYIGDHNFLSKKYGPVAANVYGKEFLLAMDKPNSTPKNSKEYAMNVVKSYIEGYNLVSKKYGSVAANVYGKVFLRAIEKQNRSLENARTYALNFAIGYAQAKKQDKKYNEIYYATAYADYIDRGGDVRYARAYALVHTIARSNGHDSDLYENLHLKNCKKLVDTFDDSNTVKNYLEFYENSINSSLNVQTPNASYNMANVSHDMHKIAASKAMAYARAKMRFTVQRMDPGKYAEEYSKVYVGKFNDLISKNTDVNRAHILAEGYAYAFVELGYVNKIAEAGLIAERYAYARENGFNDEQARAFP